MRLYISNALALILVTSLTFHPPVCDSTSIAFSFFRRCLVYKVGCRSLFDSRPTHSAFDFWSHHTIIFSAQAIQQRCIWRNQPRFSARHMLVAILPHRGGSLSSYKSSGHIQIFEGKTLHNSSVHKFEFSGPHVSRQHEPLFSHG